MTDKVEYDVLWSTLSHANKTTKYCIHFLNIYICMFLFYLYFFRPENTQSVRNDIEEDGGQPDETVPCIGNSTYNDYGKCY
jgi:amino acid permease